MGVVISLAQQRELLTERQLEKEFSNIIKNNNQYLISVSPSLDAAVRFIADWQNPLIDPYMFADTTAYFARTMPEAHLDAALRRKNYYWDLEQGESTITLSRTMKFADEFNFFLDEHCFSVQETYAFLYEFFVQSFLDSYNNWQNFSHINFKSPQQKRREAMNEDNQKILGLLQDKPYITGFTARGPQGVKTKNEFLEDVFQYRKENIYTYRT